MNFDPKLKRAVLEIEAVMRKHDIGGAISLTSETHVEYLLVLDPTWAVINQIRNKDGDGVQLHIRSKRSDFESAEAQRKANELTAHLIFSQRDLAAITVKQLGMVESMLKSKWDIEHKAITELKNTEHNT